MNQRDLELLSSYLDGQLTPSDSARLESRLKSDGQLVAALDDLRAARTLLRQLPKRRAPRNFTLTRKMVGLNPPLPRSYPAFRFATVVATLLFFFTFGINTLAPQLAQVSPFGMGGGAPEIFSAAPAATQAPAFAEAAATEAPATEAPAATEAPLESSSDLAPLPTAETLSQDSARALETPMTKVGDAENAGEADQPQVANDVSPQGEPLRPAPMIPSMWQSAFAVIAILGASLMALLRRGASNRWK
jgi:anti-sigma factor RsiW